MIRFIILAIMLIGAILQLQGCQNLGYSGMTAEQIKATAGTTTCTTYTGLYGKGSVIAINEQDVRKGVNATGDLTITCGEAQMGLKSTVAVPPK